MNHVVYARPALTDELPSFLDEVIAVAVWVWRLVRAVPGLLRYVLDVVVAALTHPTEGRHTGGATEEYVAELKQMNNELADTEQFAAVEDVTETGFSSLSGDLAETVAFNWLDRLDADLTFVATLRAAGEWPTATDVAFAAGARRAGGA